MSGEHTNLLAQLQDIHAAAEPGLWPPAPGWWVLGLALLLLLARLLSVAARRLHVRRRQKAWLTALASLRTEHDPAANPHNYLAALNRLFRAVALRAFPDTACARLEGEAWVAFITGLMPEAEDTEKLSALARGPYEPLPVYNVAELEGLAARWVERYG
jgi:hypothetical protein